MIKVENNIPIPPRGDSRVSDEIRMLSKLKVGQSFKMSDRRRQSGILTRAKTMKIKIITRKTDDGGFRIWRVKEL